jgi:hypothetical protein
MFQWRKSVQLGKTGIVGDRQYMVTDIKGNFITMRQQPALALISLEPHADGGFTLSAPDMPDLVVNYDSEVFQYLNTMIRGKYVQLQYTGVATTMWLSRFLAKHGTGGTYRIFRFGEKSIRQDKKSPAYSVALQDGAQLLMISQQSLEDHNARLIAQGLQPSTMARFRPNIVISADGLLPHMEDAWQELQIGDVRLVRRGLCFRCQITSVDEVTGQYLGKENLAALANYRTFDLSDMGYGKGAAFGTYYNISSMPEGAMLNVGDQLRIIS